MKEFMSSTGLLFLAGMAVGLVLELVAVFLTMYMVRRNTPPRQTNVPETRSTTARPVEQLQTRPDTRPTPAVQPYRREPAIVVGRTSSDIRRPAPPTRVERPIVERVIEPAVEQVITEESGPTAPALSKAALSRAPQLLYFVTGIEEPYSTLREAVDAFPDEKGKYDSKPVQWSSLPKYVRDNIQRREIVA